MENTMVANTNTQIQRSEQEQDLLAFCEQRPVGESIEIQIQIQIQ